MKTDLDTPYVLLIPGAWMGAWIWDPTVSRLRSRGIDADSLTLAGLESGASASRIAEIRLADHVEQVTDHLVCRVGRPAVLVGHSYSGMVAAQVADCGGDRIVTSIHFDSFLPAHGRSLIDDWGPDDAARAQERTDILDAHYQWAPPPAAALSGERGLSPENRRYLAERLTPHPGHTVLDPATMQQPVGTQRGTYIASSSGNVPGALTALHTQTWHVRVVESGHWPMLERPDDVASLIADLVGSAT